MRKLPARKLLWLAVTGALFLPFKGFTLGLGEIEVNSALNQKLSAEIEFLSATVEDTENIIIKLASRKEFTRAGLDRPYMLNDLRFKSEVIDGTPIIRVTSVSPVREPYLNFLIDIDWPNGHMLREYTVLLDPPVFMTQTSSAVSGSPYRAEMAAESADFRPTTDGSVNIAPVAAAGFTSSRPQASEQPSAQTFAVASANSATRTSYYAPATVNQPAGSYRIKLGDTSWSLADSMRPDQSVSIEQMMVAMLRRNPESFINDNINGLKRGYILRVPDYDQIISVSHDDALVMVREQAALWRQFQQSVNAGQPVSAMPADAGSTIEDAGRAADAGGDFAHLEIVSAGSGASTTGSKDPTSMTATELRAELALARERVETEKVEKEALQQQVNVLKGNVDRMKGMLSIEDNELSGMQSLNKPADAADSAEIDEQELQALQEALDEEIAAESMDGVEAAEDELTEELAEELAADLSSELSEISSEEADDEAIFVDEATAVPEEVQPEQLDTDTAHPATIVSTPETVDPLTKLLSDPMLLAGAGSGLLLIVALIGLIIRKRRQASEETEVKTPGFAAKATGADDLESIAADAEEDASEEVDSAKDDLPVEDDEAEESFDSDATMVLNSADDTIITEAASEVAEVDDVPHDDVIAEADVYLAYGIYQQAEELLTQAIADNPDRDDYRVKLAETHYSAKNAEAFLEVAGELKKRAENDDVPAWKKVMVMGQDLCPDDELFQGSMPGDVDSLAPKTPEMDFDLGLNEAEEAAPELDLSPDNEAEESVVPDLDLSSDNEAEESAPDLDLSLDNEVEESATELNLSLDDDALEVPEIEEATGETIDEGATQILDLDDMPVEDETAEADDVLEFDLTDSGAIEELDDAEEGFSLDIDASELDIDIESEAVEEAADEEEIAIDLSDELEALEMDVSEDEATDEQETEEEVIDLDIGADAGDEALDIDIGVKSEDDAVIEVVSEETAVSTDDLVDEDDFDLSSLDDVDEINTKLDLARAYLDMGDHEGTLAILEEVIADGSEEQKKEATELMTSLA